MGEPIPAAGPAGDPDTLVANPGATGPILFCFSGLFADAPALLGLARAVATIPVRVLQPPGMDWASAGETEIAGMARHFAGRVGRIQPEGPLHFLGACFGSTLAYATAGELEARGRRVATLILLDSVAPRTGEATRHDLAELSPRQIAQYPFLAAGIPVARAYVSARTRYRPRPGLGTALDLVRAAGPGRPAGRDRRLDWAGLAGAGFQVHPIEGWHEDVLGSQLAAAARLVRDRLGERKIRGLALAELGATLPRIELGRTPAGAPALVEGDGTTRPVRAVGGRGYLESVLEDGGRLFVTGWALDPEAAAPAGEVLFFMGGRLAGRARRTHDPRPDLAAVAGPGGSEGLGFAGDLELGADDRAGDRPLQVFSAGSGAAVELPDLTASPWTRTRTRGAPVRRMLAEVARLARG